ncbi:MAG TPA: outer membrane protein assembly factor BamC [Chromobacteriaceae bacterium]|nr:outer membrane protein assembly factor BamC [Chromobacteriaceae bacterium]
MKRTAPVAILLATGILAGCSTQEPLEKKLDYKSDTPKIANTLEVPPDLTAPQIRNKYAIPGNNVSASALNDTAQPVKRAPSATETVAVNTIDNVQMERAGTQRWLLVSGKKPVELWPVLKAFWQDNGFIIKTEEPDLGIMETDWAENRAKLPNDMIRKFMDTVGLGSVMSTAERDKFRIRLEKTANGTEVYFSHRGMYEVYVDEGKSQTKWQPRPTDPGLEAELLGRFMVRLGLTEEKAKEAVKKTLVAPEKPQDPIVDGKLVINDSFDRTWRRVGLALDRVGLVVNDRDRSQGTYYVKPAKSELDPNKPESSGGFWSSLAFWKSSEKPAQQESSDDYRIVLKENGNGTTLLSIQDKQGKDLTGGFAKTALGKLQVELQ